MNVKSIIQTGALLGAASVAIGAFGAHGLESMADTGKIELKDLHTFETAVRYQFFHVLALLAIAALYTHLNPKRAHQAVWAFLIGIIIFSGSLYLLTLSPVIFGTRMSWLGAITPLGGLSFIVGWILLFSGARMGK